MGNNLTRQHEGTDGRPSEASVPSELDGAVHLIQRSAPVLEDLREYHGAGDHIRAACGTADAEAQRRAVDRVSANMHAIMQFYEFSTDIAGTARDLSTKLSRNSIDSDIANVTGNLVLFCFEFDQLKNSTPSLQNDVSYYRRVVSRSDSKTMGADCGREDGLVSAENAQAAAMWLSQPCPMTSCLAPLPAKFLCLLGDYCRTTVASISKSDKVESNRWLKTWAACIILYDRISPAPGAFTKRSPMQIKLAIKAIRQRLPPTDVEHLLNCLRYSSMNYNGPATTRGIQRSFETGSYFSIGHILSSS